MHMQLGIHHSASLSVCRTRQSRGCAACGWSGARLMKSSRRMPFLRHLKPPALEACQMAILSGSFTRRWLWWSLKIHSAAINAFAMLFCNPPRCARRVK